MPESLEKKEKLCRVFPVQFVEPTFTFNRSTLRHQSTTKDTALPERIPSRTSIFPLPLPLEVSLASSRECKLQFKYEYRCMHRWRHSFHDSTRTRDPACPTKERERKKKKGRGRANDAKRIRKNCIRFGESRSIFIRISRSRNRSFHSRKRVFYYSRSLFSRLSSPPSSSDLSSSRAHLFE